MRYLLLGGAGFIGSNLTESLLQDGHTVAILDNFSFSKPPKDNPPNFMWTSCDVGNSRGVESFASSVKPDIVIWLPAIHYYDLKKEPTIQTAWLNYSLVRVLPVVYKVGAKAFVLASSDLVYKPDKKILVETSKLNWGDSKTIIVNKIISEWYTVMLCKKLRLPFLLLRFSNVVGNRLYSSPVIDRLTFMIDLLLTGNYYILDKPEQQRDYIFINDAVEMTKNILYAEKFNEAYNLSSGVGISNLELSQHLTDLIKPAELPKVVKTKEGDLVLSNRKVTSLGKVTLTNIIDTLPDLIQLRREMLGGPH